MANHSAHMCIWPESEASRGSNEIASCLYKHFIGLHQKGALPRRVVLWSDSCSGQNKNRTVIVLWWYLIQRGFFDVVEHKFPEVGHTRCASDGDFGTIEKCVHRESKLHLPDDYVTIIAGARENPEPFNVTLFGRDDFLDFKLLAKSLTVRTNTVRGEKISFMRIRWMRFDKQQPFIMKYRYSFDENESWKVVSHKKGLRKLSPGLVNAELNQVRRSARPISTQKYNDLQVCVSQSIEKNRRIYMRIVFLFCLCLC